MTKANVHYKCKGKNGDLYGIGVWDDLHNQYQAPLSATSRKLTGCFAEFARIPIGTMSKRRAQQEARKLWGYVKTAK